jgi:hypothetical protein
VNANPRLHGSHLLKQGKLTMISPHITRSFFFPFVVFSTAVMAGEPVSIDSRGSIVIGSERVFVHGMYHDSMDVSPSRFQQDLRQDLQRIVAANFNTVWVSLDPTWGTVVQDHFTYLHDNGIHVIANVSPSNLSALLPHYRSVQPLIAVSAGDDFNYPGGSPHYQPSEIAAHRALIEKELPNALVVASGGAHPVLPVAGYAGAMDAMGLQCYPISNTAENVPGGAPYELEMCDDMFTFVRNQLGGRYPILPTLQAFKWYSAGARYPTVQELRNMLYTTLQFAPAGILWYSYYDGRQLLGTDKPDLWQELSLLTGDIGQLERAFLFGVYTKVVNPNDPYMSGTEGAWHAARWDHDGTTYVIVTNTDKDTAKTVDFALSGKQTMQPLFANARYANSLRYENGRVRGSAAPQSVHVYVLTTGDLKPSPPPYLTAY